MRCFTNSLGHLGHNTTSICEGLHGTMKIWLWALTGDLATVFVKLRDFWTSQRSKVAIASIDGRD